MAVLFRILQTESEAQRSDLPRCGSQDLQPSHWATRLHVSSATSCWGCQWKTPSHKTRGPRPFKANCRGTKENHYYSYYALGAHWHFLSKQSLCITVWYPARWPDEFSSRQTDLLCRWLSSAVCKNENSRREDYHFRKFIKRVYEEGSLGGKDWWSPWETVP